MFWSGFVVRTPENFPYNNLRFGIFFTRSIPQFLVVWMLPLVAAADNMASNKVMGQAEQMRTRMESQVKNLATVEWKVKKAGQLGKQEGRGKRRKCGKRGKLGAN